MFQISQSIDIGPQFESISFQTLKSNYRIHPSITTFQENASSFNIVDMVDDIREITKLNRKKAVQDDDDRTIKILKENVNLFAENICIFHKNTINISYFPSFLQMVNVTL